MKIKSRLYLSTLISIILAVIFVSVVFLFSSKIAEKNEELKLAEEIKTAISELGIITYEYLLHREKRMEEQWNVRYNSGAIILRKGVVAEKETISDDYVELGRIFLQVTGNYEKTQSSVQAGVTQERIDATILLDERLVAQLLIKSQSIITATDRFAKKIHGEVTQIQKATNNIILLLMIILAVATVTTSLLVVGSISKALAKLLKGTETIAKGNLEQRIDIKNKDEIGQLTLSFNEMTDRLQESYTGLKKEITERKRAEEKIQTLNRELEYRLIEIRAANKELEAFSYSVSHDLRTPLRAIDGFSQILLEDHREKLDKEGRRVLDIIRDNTGRMGELISDLLALSRLGRKEIIKKDINMEELTRNIFEELRSAAPQTKIKMKINTLPSAFGDESLIREVLANLISNAIKFSRNEKSPVIEVGGKSENNENIYYVKDNGVGFDMKYSDKLFGVFQRLHSQQEFKGTGVGLAIVRRIIERHGGRGEAEGKVNKGATFYFTLPLRKRKETKEENEK